LERWFFVNTGEKLNGAGVGDAGDADEQLEGVLEQFVVVDEDADELGDAVLQISDQEVWCRRGELGSLGDRLASQGCRPCSLGPYARLKARIRTRWAVFLNSRGIRLRPSRLIAMITVSWLISIRLVARLPDPEPAPRLKA